MVTTRGVTVEQRASKILSPAIGEEVPIVVKQQGLISGIKAFNHKISEGAKLKLKLAVSAILFASLFLFNKIDLTESWKAAAHANAWYLSAAVSIYLLSFFIMAHRWQLLAIAVGFKKSLFQLTQYCYVGMFFNLFLPSTVGGDFSRCYYLSKGTNKYANAFYSVLADRTLGIAVLFFMAFVGITLAPAAKALPIQLKLPIFIGTIGVFGIMPFVPWLAKTFLGKRNWISRQLNDTAAATYWQDKKLMLVCFIWTIIYQTVMVGIHIAIGFGLGLHNIPLWYYFVFYPAVAVLGFVTPSFNGIGIREWAYTYFLTVMGVDRAHALTYAIMWLGLTTFMSLFGGLVYMIGHFKISKEEMEHIQHQPLEV